MTIIVVKCNLNAFDIGVFDENEKKEARRGKT